MASERDYYQVLGVLETATTDEIKKAFRRLAKQYHPDRNPGKPQAAGRFKEINEAHDVLSDPAKRKQYDQLRKYGALAGAGRYGGAGRGPGPGRGGGGGPADSGVEFDLSDLGSFGGLGDLFSSIFGKRGEGRMEEAEDEVEATVSIPFRVAALGGKVPVTLPMAEVCPTCGGDGAAPGATISVCPECNGRGTISFGQGGFAVNRPCPVCRGKGRVPSTRCGDRKSTRLNSSHGYISYAVFCLKKKNIKTRSDRYKLPIAHGREEEHESDSLFFPFEGIRYRMRRNGFLRYQ